MDKTAREHNPVVAVGTDASFRWTVQRHVAARIDYVVNQVAASHRGQSEDSIAKEIADRLRALGVSPQQRQVQHLAETISRLPRADPSGAIAAPRPIGVSPPSAASPSSGASPPSAASPPLGVPPPSGASPPIRPAPVMIIRPGDGQAWGSQTEPAIQGRLLA